MCDSHFGILQYCFKYFAFHVKHIPIITWLAVFLSLASGLAVWLALTYGIRATYATREQRFSEPLCFFFCHKDGLSLIRSTHSCWAPLVAQMVKTLPAMQEIQVGSLGREDPLEKGMATHSTLLARRIPRLEEPGGTVHGVAKNQTHLSDQHFHLHSC